MKCSCQYQLQYFLSYYYFKWEEIKSKNRTKYSFCYVLANISAATLAIFKPSYYFVAPSVATVN